MAGSPQHKSRPPKLVLDLREGRAKILSTCERLATVSVCTRSAHTAHPKCTPESAVLEQTEA